MKYGKIVEGKFIDRPNRFIAHVEIAGESGDGACEKYRKMQGTFAPRGSGASGTVG